MLTLKSVLVTFLSVVAEIKSMSVEDVCAVTTRNAAEFYKLKLLKAI